MPETEATAVLFLILEAAERAQRSRVDPAADAPVPTDEAILLTEIKDLLRSQGGLGGRVWSRNPRYGALREGTGTIRS